MRSINAIVWLLIIAAVGWFGYNYFVVAERDLDESLEVYATEGTEALPAGVDKDRVAECMKGEVKRVLPSLYGWEVKYRLALRSALFRPLGMDAGAPTNIYWTYAINSHFGGKDELPQVLFDQAMGISALKCVAASTGG